MYHVCDGALTFFKAIEPLEVTERYLGKMRQKYAPYTNSFRDNRAMFTNLAKAGGVRMFVAQRVSCLPVLRVC